LFYFGLDAGTGKGESNYFSTLSRFQAAAAPAAEIAFAGSSITGRIPGREAGNQNIANLGSDGGPALDGIRMLVQGRIARPQWLVIEANTLYGGVGFGDSLITRNAQGPWFDVGASMPLLGASARPSAMMYAFLLQRAKVKSGEAFTVKSQAVASIDLKIIEKFSFEEIKRFSAYRDSLILLRQQGVKLLFVNYPAGTMKEKEKTLMNRTVALLSNQLAIPYLDLAEQIPREELQFTDSVHLGPHSAARVMSTIEAFCAEYEKNNSLQ
jgi:hypothetical protein